MFLPNKFQYLYYSLISILSFNPLFLQSFIKINPTKRVKRFWVYW